MEMHDNSSWTGAHVAGRLLSNQDVPSCGSSLSLCALPFRRPASVVAVAISAGAEWKSGGLRVVMCSVEIGLLSCSASVTPPVTPIHPDTFSCCVAVGCLSDLVISLAWDAKAFAACVGEWWKRLSEHDRAEVL